MATPASKTELLKSQEKELIKSHCVLNVNGQPSTIYTAQASALNGDFCTRVDYQYDGTYITVVVGMKESYSTWNSAWDF